MATSSWLPVVLSSPFDMSWVASVSRTKETGSLRRPNAPWASTLTMCSSKIGLSRLNPVVFMFAMLFAITSMERRATIWLERLSSSALSMASAILRVD